MRLGIRYVTRGLAGIALAAAALAVPACGGEEPPRSGDDGTPVSARLTEAVTMAWPQDLRVTASVSPYRRATPGTVLMGRIDRVVRREGDRVTAGQVLAHVESREVNARLAQAEAAVEAARAMEENARLMRERMERLHERKAASQKNLDDAVAGHEAALANLKAAEEGVKAARVYVSHSTVTAPFSGWVTERRVEEGDLAAPGMPLFVVEDLSRVKIEASVPESRVTGLRPGQPVAVETGGAIREGTLHEILPAADPRSRTFTVRVILDNPDESLRSGMFARLSLPGSETSRVAVPEAALVRRGPLTGVFVVDEGSVARLRWVTSGRIRDGMVEVLTGLEAGETIVADPPEGLRDGARVGGA